MLPEHEWLPQAKRLAVGMKVRIHHRREGRANMTIGNERDRWWCWCQRCKEGAVVNKEHVLLSAPVEVQEHECRVPDDLRPVIGSDYEQTVGRFLASKGMMFPYLPKLWFSERAKRLCLQDDSGGWHGRDLTGRSNAKWLHYSKPHWVGHIGLCTVIAEDIFSMYKMRFAFRGESKPYCFGTTLGAGCSPSAALALKNCTRIVWAYDGDSAGDAGYASGSKRMRAFGPKQYRARPPEGMDPKDMSCEAIREMILGALK